MQHSLKRVLAVDPNHKGFGYVVLESPHFAVDWGLATVRKPLHTGCLRRIAELCDQYQPDIIVIEDGRASDSRRCARVRRLLQEIERWGTARGIRVRTYTPRAVRKAFAGRDVHNKDQVARAVLADLPELCYRLPPIRKCYMPEDLRMSIFDSAALASMAYLGRKQGQKVSVHTSVTPRQLHALLDRTQRVLNVRLKNCRSRPRRFGGVESPNHESSKV